MEFVTHYEIAGVKSKQIPSIVGSGAPTTSTKAAVGCMYMDDLTGRMYRCTAASGESYTWEENVGEPGRPGNDGTSPIVSVSDITGGHKITITDKTSTKHIDVMDGKPGHTPVVGEDYFTDEDKREIAEQAAELVESPTVPVQSVNGKTGAVSLSASDVKARPDNWMPTAQDVGARPNTWIPSAQEVGALPDTYTPPNQTAEQVGADPKGTADTAVSQHNTSADSHNDIRLALKAINDRLTSFFDSDDATLDELSEIVAYITSNKTLIEAITTSKVSVSDIVNNLITNVANKPLSAAQGVALKALIDAIKVPTKVSELTNDKNYLSSIPSEYVTETELNAKGYLTQHQDLSAYAKTADLGSLAKKNTVAATDLASDVQTSLGKADTALQSFTETDPTVPAWAKVSTKPSYTKSEVGLGNVDNVKQYSASNPPPYPVTKVNNKTGAVTLSASDVGAISAVYEWVTPTVEINNGMSVYGYNIGGSFRTQSSPTLSYIRVDVSNFQKLRVRNAYMGDSSYGYNLVIFSAITDVIIDKYSYGSQGTIAEQVELTVPSGAVYAYINSVINTAVYISGYKRYDTEVLVNEKANRIADWLTLTGTLKSKTLVYGSTGANEAANNNGELLTCDVTGIKKVRVRGYHYSVSYNYAACYFYDANGKYIEKHFAGSSDNMLFNQELDVPDGAAILKVNGHIYEQRPEVSGYRVFDIEDLYDELRPKGKKLITLGDSITALGTGNTGWVKYFIEKTGCKLIANVAVNGAWLHDKAGTVYDGNPVFQGADNDVNNVLGNQVQKIINNNYEAPDIIMIAIGTNAGISITKEQIKAAYYDSSNNLIPLDNVDRKTSAGAYRWCLEKLHAKYPNALIFWCTPIMGHQLSRSAENAMAYAESLRIATEYTGQMMIDTIRCGINGVNEKYNANGEYLIDGLHPNANGAKKIGYYNASKVMPFLGNNFVEV